MAGGGLFQQPGFVGLSAGQTVGFCQGLPEAPSCVSQGLYTIPRCRWPTLFSRLALCRAFATPSQSSTVRVRGQAVPATHTPVSSRLVLPALPECALWNFVLLGAWEGHNTAGRQVRSHEGGWGGVAVCVSECSAPGLSGSQVSRQVSGHNGCRRTEDIC